MNLVKPSLALPPLYVFCTGEGCPKCRRAAGVYALGCTAFHDARNDEPTREFHLLRFVTSAPAELTTLLTEKCQTYFLDNEELPCAPYLMNHCGCGAKLDDDYLHGHLQAAFWHGQRSEYEHMMLFRLPVTQPVPVRCSFALGGGHYLRVCRTLEW